MTMKNDTLTIAVLPGDGIGREVMPACLELVNAATTMAGAPALAFQTHNAGAQYYAESGDALPASTLEACRKSDAILFGAMGWPDIRFPDGTEIIPQLDLRMELGLFAGVRPIRWFPGLPRVLTDPRAEQIDFVLVREQTEGLFYARGRGEIRNDEEAYDTMQITRSGTERVTEFAFDIARQRKRRGKPGNVTCVDKANVFQSMAFFRKVFDEVADRHSDLTKDHAYVDALALNMVKKPWTFDVLVTENMFGDILSDLAAGLIGGMGMAPSADIGDKHGLFQPAHGTAPDIAGKGCANPSAMFLSAAMMLDWLAAKFGQPTLADAARLMEGAVEHTLSTKLAIPMEYGGNANCAEMTRSVISSLSAARKEVA